MDIPAKKGTVLKRGLGRGIGALLPDVVSPEKGQLLQCQIRHIEADANQPRRRFVDENLAELALSIKEHGVIQPLLVKPAATAGQFTLIAGERRLRAATKAGLGEVPVIVMDVNEAQGLQVSLIENLQREDRSIVPPTAASPGTGSTGSASGPAGAEGDSPSAVIGLLSFIHRVQTSSTP